MSWQRVLTQTSAEHGPQGLALHLDLEPEPSEVRRARDFVRERLAGYEQAELDVITLLLSELLTNAILYGRSQVAVDISVHLRPEDSKPRPLGVWGPDPVSAILVGVSDGSSRLPQPRPPRELPENGLGLQIVGQLADGWGTMPLRDDPADGPLEYAAGKIVWFLVNVRLPKLGSAARSEFTGTRPPA
jgi:anti-sigma regulatory factor (Ser/Thr protein kinase)